MSSTAIPFRHPSSNMASTTAANPGRPRPKAGLHLNLPPNHQTQAKAPSMISFDGLPPEVMQAMCTPMHQILPPASLPASPGSQTSNGHHHPSYHPQSRSSYPSPAHPSHHRHTGALYLGSLAASIDRDLLSSHRISHLVQVIDAPWLPTPPDGTRCHRINIMDLPSADLRSHLEEACEVIDGAIGRGENVLVHCQQGISRSAAIVIAYLISKHGMSYESAHDLVRHKRPCIKPNSGFVKCLRDWEGMWRAKAAQLHLGQTQSGYAQAKAGSVRRSMSER
ncbi:hypothetical protein JAAARDRAFT_41005 [Jaapia argillacea MUCL 33604]|uniref:protein-tyrosine-phosphatase n=1 Tax=Jaapia argillacea MUCL 33604 TaxID=933084 RepID=A0A067PCK2_9AGAM|nr:hypothetical protein JAAARDRAFT_41005 [Jaapia argillacea MUCL 33604]